MRRRGSLSWGLANSSKLSNAVAASLVLLQVCYLASPNPEITDPAPGFPRGLG